MEIQRPHFETIRTVAIYGHTGSGKTSFAYKLLEILRDKQIYFLKHPKPELIESMGYHNLDSMEQIEEAENCVLYLDEPQLYLGIYDKKSNSVIAKVCSLARQLNITLIISSSDTRVFTKGNEAYFDLWIVKDLDYSMVKNGSKIKEIIKNNSLFDPAGFHLKENEYLADCRRLRQLNGKHTFVMPQYFTIAHSKPFARRNEQVDIAVQGAIEANSDLIDITVQTAKQNSEQNTERNTDIKSEQNDELITPKKIQ